MSDVCDITGTLRVFMRRLVSSSIPRRICRV
jgi:hypothetical protein